MLNYEYILNERTRFSEAVASTQFDYLTQIFNKLIDTLRKHPGNDDNYIRSLFTEYKNACNEYFGKVTQLGRNGVTDDLPPEYKEYATYIDKFFAYLKNNCKSKTLAEYFEREHRDHLKCAINLIDKVNELEGQMTDGHRNMYRPTSELQQYAER